MYAMNIQNDVIGFVLRENCKSKQMTDFIAWPSRCHDMIFLFHMIGKYLFAFLLMRKTYFDWGMFWKKFYEHNENAYPEYR